MGAKGQLSAEMLVVLQDLHRGLGQGGQVGRVEFPRVAAVRDEAARVAGHQLGQCPSGKPRYRQPAGQGFDDRIRAGGIEVC